LPTNPSPPTFDERFSRNAVIIPFRVAKIKRSPAPLAQIRRFRARKENAPPSFAPTTRFVPV
jgi:hypothetical protein